MKLNKFAGALAIMLSFAVIAKADVIVKHKSNSDMAGMVSMEMTGTDSYKADKCYSDQTSKMTGGMMAMLGKGKPKETVTITRLDKGVTWDVNTEKKSYTETSLESLKQKLSESGAEADNADEKQEEPDYVWTVDVKAIDEPQVINGFNCKGVIGKSTGIKKDNPADSMFITYEQWMAKDVPGAAEMETYHQNYAKAVGVNQMWVKENMGAMLNSYGSQFAELGAKVSEAGSYPIRTIITVESSAKQEKQDSEESPNMMGQMGKLFGKKKAEKSEGEKAGRTRAFFMSNEILSVEQKPVDDAQFEVPAGYKKK